MATSFARAGICLLTAIASSGMARAQTVLPQSQPPIAAPRTCTGVLCSLTPAAMERPIGAEDARRMEAERASQAAETAPVMSGPRRTRHRHEAVRHTRMHGRSVASRAATPRQRHAEALAASRADVKAVKTAETMNAPINAIFVLAPRPFDPYGGDYTPWLVRLSWRSSADHADDRTVFTPDGYAQATRAPVAERASTDAADDLARRTDALSQRGFQALKLDFGRS